MNDREIFDLYVAQSANVRHLKQVIDQTRNEINLYLRKSNTFQVMAKTKILSLLYSAWSEAQFVQIAFTEHGFAYSEIRKILAIRSDRGIAEGWRFLINSALSRVGDVNTNRDLRGRLKKLLSLVKDYIEEPSVLRNKIAHGQWVHAINSKTTAVNPDVTLLLKNLDFVEIEKRIEIHKYLGFIVRDLVQSPKAGFHRHYWTNIVFLEQYLKKTLNWTLASKKTLLLKKPIKINSREPCGVQQLDAT